MLIQSCLPGMTGDSRTILPARETIGNQLFSLDFSRALLHAGPSLFALRVHSPSLLKPSGLLSSLPHPASQRSGTVMLSGENNLGFVLGALTAGKKRSSAAVVVKNTGNARKSLNIQRHFSYHEEMKRVRFTNPKMNVR